MKELMYFQEIFEKHFNFKIDALVYIMINLISNKSHLKSHKFLNIKCHKHVH